jgi:hypothetical protein
MPSRTGKLQMRKWHLEFFLTLMAVRWQLGPLVFSTLRRESLVGRKAVQNAKSLKAMFIQ